MILKARVQLLLNAPNYDCAHDNTAVHTRREPIVSGKNLVDIHNEVCSFTKYIPYYLRRQEYLHRPAQVGIDSVVNFT